MTGETRDGGTIRVTLHGQVAELLINRPAKHNAITPAMAADLAAARALDADAAVRAVLLHGAGAHAVCAGSDLLGRSRVEYATAIRNIRKPVVAALQGWTLGGGAEMALGADIRIARQAGVTFPSSSCHPAAVSGKSLIVLRTAIW